MTSNKSATSPTKEEHVTADDETVVDPEQGSVLSHIISQLRPGADLSRVTLPTFFLEPRSMLERITNFMAHPETLLPMPTVDDPVQRFVQVVKFYLSGWHIKPPGVKKPLNPILGEIFTCYWDYPDNTRGYYIAEQTSHHPPKSSYFFMAPEHHIRIDGTLKPRSKFLGNSAASLMEGIAVMRFLNRGERYFITQPNMYARGILFGKMKYELGDHSFVRCPESGLVADLEFKTKGYFSGTYNAIGGFIKESASDRALFELSGHWNGEMWIKDLTTNKRELLFDATHAKETYPSVRPIEEQDERESQRLWHGVTNAVIRRDQDAATDEKSEIENRQREEAAKRADQGIDWQPRLFRRVHGGRGGSEEGEENLDWIINAKIDATNPKAQTEQILAIAPILPGQVDTRRPSIPPMSEIRRSKSNHASVNDEKAAYAEKQPEADLSQHNDGTNDEKPTQQQQELRPPAQEAPPPPDSNEKPPPAASSTSSNMEKSASSIRPGIEPVMRADSETNDMDEFHDAES